MSTVTAELSCAFPHTVAVLRVCSCGSAPAGLLLLPSGSPVGEGATSYQRAVTKSPAEVKLHRERRGTTCPAVLMLHPAALTSTLLYTLQQGIVAESQGRKPTRTVFQSYLARSPVSISGAVSTPSRLDSQSGVRCFPFLVAPGMKRSPPQSPTPISACL